MPMSQPDNKRTPLAVIADVASIVSALVVVGVASALLAANSSRRPSPLFTADVDQRPRPKAQLPPIVAVTGLETKANLTAMRPVGARIAVVEFADFQCPYCGVYAREVYPRIVDRFVKTGQVVYVFRHFPLASIHPLAFRASEAAECAQDQGQYWNMHDLLFSNQHGLDDENLKNDASALGLNRSKFAKCLSMGRSGIVRADQLEGERLGVRATPTFLVGTIMPDDMIKVSWRISGAQSFETFKTAIDGVASGVSALP